MSATSGDAPVGTRGRLSASATVRAIVARGHETMNAIRGDGNGQRPWWATFVVNVGVPAAICLFLVYFVTFSLHARVAALESITAETLAMMREASKSMHAFSENQARLELQRERLLRQICINTSKPEAIALCGQ